MTVSLRSALAGELFRLRRRRFSWVALAATAAVGFLGSVAPRIEELVKTVQQSVGGEGRGAAHANAFVYLATGAKGASILAGLFVALAAAGAVAGEAASGTLRLALCRPVGRGTVYLAKLLSLAVFLEALLVAGFGAAIAGAAVVGEFGPVVVILEKSSAGQMAGRTLFAFALSHLALLGIMGLALLASTLARSAASATAAALGSLVISALLLVGFESSRPYLFTSYATASFDTLRDYAIGQDAPRPVWFGLPTLQDWADTTFAVALPVFSALLLLGAAARIFTKRDWLT